MKNILDVLYDNAIQYDASKAFTILHDGEIEGESVTFSDLYWNSLSVAIFLSEMKIEEQRIVVIFNTSLNFLFAFFGCLMAGAIAVPLSTPKNGKKDHRLTSVIKDSRPKLILTSKSLLESISKKISEPELKIDIKILAIEDVFENNFSSCTRSLRKHDSFKTSSGIAFLQYTSGSTGNPKGVMVSHKNIISNQQMIKDAFCHDQRTIFGGWLPLFHDMGLIGNILQPVFLGVHAVLMTPMHFIQKPIRWLKMISEYKVTTSGGPNFAYNLCVNKIQDEALEDIDLSTWKIAFNGSERVLKKTVDEFSKKFKAIGFKESAIFPCYGLSEATLFVTGERVEEKLNYLSVNRHSLKNRLIKPIDVKGGESEQGVDVVSCGTVWGDEEILIVNENTLNICARYEIGEIWIRGPNVAQGYWGKSVENNGIFGAKPSNKNAEEDYLRTGDLGFVDGNGRLYITGRIKELIIINGRNFCPYDIEEIARQADPILGDCIGAAFSVKGKHGDGFVVIMEIGKKFINSLNKEIITELVIGKIVGQHGIAPLEVIFVRSGSIPRTSSGKIQRIKCSEMYELKSLNVA